PLSVVDCWASPFSRSPPRRCSRSVAARLPHTAAPRSRTIQHGAQIRSAAPSPLTPPSSHPPTHQHSDRERFSVLNFRAQKITKWRRKPYGQTVENLVNLRGLTYLN